jgi:hypothetical protein
VAFAFLQGTERVDVPQDAVEIVLAADLQVRRSVAGIERDAKLVELGRDEGAAIALIEEGCRWC